MASNRGVAYIKPGQVEVQSIDFPKLALGKRKCNHGVILKIISTNICGSDQHMVRGRTTAPAGLVLGHEITGEVIEAGRDVEFIKEGAEPVRVFIIDGDGLCAHNLFKVLCAKGRVKAGDMANVSSAARRGCEKKS